MYGRGAYAQDLLCSRSHGSGAPEDQVSCPPVLTPHPGDRAGEAYLVELGQLAVGSILLDRVLGT